MSHLLSHLFSFLTTLVATRRRRCLLRSAWVNVMPEWLLSVISGILAGGIPGFRIELCCFFHPLVWPPCVFPGCLCFASFSGHTHDDTQDVIDICGEMNPLVFSALEGMNLVFTLMVSSTVMVDIVFARFIFCTFYWR